MKSCIKIALTLVLGAFAFGAVAQAPHKGGQHPGHGPSMGQRHNPMQEVWKQLHLTPAQQKKVDAIQKGTRAEMKKIHDSKLPEAQKRQKMMAIRKGEMAKINKVLTPKQRAEFKKIMEQRRSQWKQHQKGGRK